MSDSPASILYDNAGNPIGVVDDAGTKRLQVEIAGSAGGIPTDVRIKDDTDNVFANVTEAGSLKVDASPVTPTGATSKADIGSAGVPGPGYVEEVYVITNGELLTIQQFSGGGEVSSTGSRIELRHRPTGLPASDVLIAVGYANGSSFEQTINQSFLGDGTAEVVIRRENMTGGTIHITGRWVGYEKTP
jgi:hypothetical protein